MRTDLDVEYFRNRLADRLKEIESVQLQQKENTAPKELDQAKVGRLSRMDAMQQQAMSQAVARLNDQERQRIQSAFGRIESGDYGYCVLCDGEIAEGRLRFDASVLTCISCAGEADVG